MASASSLAAASGGSVARKPGGTSSRDVGAPRPSSSAIPFPRRSGSPSRYRTAPAAASASCDRRHDAGSPRGGVLLGRHRVNHPDARGQGHGPPRGARVGELASCRRAATGDRLRAQREPPGHGATRGGNRALLELGPGVVRCPRDARSFPRAAFRPARPRRAGATEGGPGPDRSPVAKMAIVWRSRPLVGRGLSTNHGAEVAEQADATVSKTVEGNLVRVQLPASAPIQSHEPPSGGVRPAPASLATARWREAAAR